MIMYFLHIDLSKKSGTTIVMVAFGAHFIRDNEDSCSQQQSGCYPKTEKNQCL